jgi:outer membrane murein-binding lipoprotein Lpp
MNRRTTITAATLLAALTLASCGGSSGPTVSQFKTEYKTQKATFEQLGTDIAQAITSAPKQSNTEIATAFNTLGTRSTAQADALRKMKVPSQFKTQVNGLATDFDTVASDLHSVGSAATASNGNAAKTAAEKLVIDAGKLKQVDTTLTQKLGLPASG